MNFGGISKWNRWLVIRRPAKEHDSQNALDLAPRLTAAAAWNLAQWEASTNRVTFQRTGRDGSNRSRQLKKAHSVRAADNVENETLWMQHQNTHPLELVPSTHSQIALAFTGTLIYMMD